MASSERRRRGQGHGSRHGVRPLISRPAAATLCFLPSFVRFLAPAGGVCGGRSREDGEQALPELGNGEWECERWCLVEVDGVYMRGGPGPTCSLSGRRWGGTSLEETRSACRTSMGAAGFAGIGRRFLLEGLMGSVTAIGEILCCRTRMDVHLHGGLHTSHQRF